MTRRSKRKESEPGANGATAADAAAPAAKKAKAKAKEKEKKGLLESPELARAQLEAISKAEKPEKWVKWVVTKMRAEGFVIGEQAARCRKYDMIKWLNVASRGVAGKKCTLCRTYLNKNGVMRQDGEAGKEVAQNGHAAY